MPFRHEIANRSCGPFSHAGADEAGEGAEADLLRVEVVLGTFSEVQREAGSVADFGHVAEGEPERGEEDGGVGEHHVGAFESLEPGLGWAGFLEAKALTQRLL